MHFAGRPPTHRVPPPHVRVVVGCSLQSDRVSWFYFGGKRAPFRSSLLWAHAAELITCLDAFGHIDPPLFLRKAKWLTCVRVSVPWRGHVSPPAETPACLSLNAPAPTMFTSAPLTSAHRPLRVDLDLEGLLLEGLQCDGQHLSGGCRGRLAAPKTMDSVIISQLQPLFFGVFFWLCSCDSAVSVPLSKLATHAIYRRSLSTTCCWVNVLSEITPL